MNVPLNINLQQILLHLFNFVILFAVLYFLLYAPVKKFMQKRTDYYKDMDDKANGNFKKSEEMKKEYSDKLLALENELDEKRQNEYKKISEEKEKNLSDAKNEADKIIIDARKKAEDEKAKILASAQNEILDMAAAAAEKIVKEKSTSDAYDSFLNSAKRGDSND